MKCRKIVGLAILAIVGASVTWLFIKQRNCPTAGLALSSSMREFVRLKNRTAEPQREDFDQRVTLAALVVPGEDRARWSEARAAAIEGYVVDVGKGGIEAANCYSTTRRDTHIYVALRADAPPAERVVLEVTPRLVESAKRKGLDWSEDALRRALVGRWCYFEGWMLFDREHAGESENTAQGREGNWRATAWEIHPVTRFEVLR